MPWSKRLTRSATVVGSLLFIGVNATACLTSRSALASRGTGMARCYRAHYDTLWSMLDEALPWVGLVVDDTNYENGFLLARSYELKIEAPEEMGLGSDQGEAVAVFVEPEGNGVWAVEVVSKPRFSLDLTARDWTKIVFHTLEDRLPQSASTPGDDLSACTRIRNR